MFPGSKQIYESSEPSAITTTLRKYEWLLIILGLSWFLVLIVEIYFGRDISQVISFQLQDPTWMPENIGPSRELIGLHHFGDLQIWLGYASIHNPLAGFVKYPPQSPPQVLWLFQFLLHFGFQPLFGIPRVLLAFWIVSVSSWLFSINKFFANQLTNKSEIRLLLAVSIFSTPVIVTFDRGSLQFLVVSSSLLFIYSCNRGKSIWASFFFVVAISLKPYCALLIIWPIAKRLWILVSLSITSSAIVTMVALWALPGSFQIALESFFRAIRGHVTGEGMTYLNDSVSSPAAVWKIANLVQIEPLVSFIERNSGSALLAIGAIVLGAVAIIVMSPYTSKSFSLIAMISTTQLIVPLSGLYTPLWVVALSPLLLREISFPKPLTDLRNAALTLSSSAFSLFALMSILPLPGSISINQYTFRLTALVAPVGMTLTVLIMAVLVSLQWIFPKAVDLQKAKQSA